MILSPIWVQCTTYVVIGVIGEYLDMKSSLMDRNSVVLIAIRPDQNDSWIFPGYAAMLAEIYTEFLID